MTTIKLYPIKRGNTYFLPTPMRRDPRSTMNAIYHPEAVKTLLDMAKSQGVPLLFVTNNVCNQFKFEDSSEVIEAMELKGLMQKLAEVWYGPHLKGMLGAGRGERCT